jgi:hypothetical protein
MIAVLLVLSLPLAATDAGLLRLTRSDVNLMLGIHVGDIAGSPLVETMLAEALASNPQWAPVLSLGGRNPLEGLDELLFSANIDAHSPQEPKDALVLFRGSVGEGRLEQLFCSEGCEREPYRNFELLKVEREDADTPGYLVVLDAQYAALGERPAVLRTIERHQKQAAAEISPTMQSWVDRLGRYHLWVAAKGPFPTGGEPEAGPAALAATAAAKMEGFGLGLLLDRDVSLAVELESSSEQDAQQLYEMLQGLLALTRLSQQQEQAEPAAFDPLEKLEVTNTGRVVSALLTIPQRELTEQLLAKLDEKRQAGDEPAGAGELRASSEASNEAEPRTSNEAGPRASSGAMPHTNGPAKPRANSSPLPSPQARPAVRRQSVIRVYGLAPRPAEYPLTPR